MTRVLVNATSGIGENLLAVPFIRQLGLSLPGAALTVAVRFDAARELLRRLCPGVEVLVLDTSRYGTPLALLRLVRELRAARFAWCFNLVPANKPVKNLFAWLVAPGRVVTHRYTHRPWLHLQFLADLLVPVDPGLHDVEQNLGLLRAAGLPLEPAAGNEVRLDPSTDEVEAAGAWLNSRGLASTPLLGLHPGSSTELGMGSKRWAAERFSAVARELERRAGLSPVVFGGPEERQLATEVAEQCGGTVCGDLALGPLAALMGRCRLVLSNDSFPMHLAAAAGAPVVALFGPTDPARTRPWTRSSRVVCLPLDCSPCWNVRHIGRPFRCTHPRPLACLRELPTETVTAACLELLAGTAAPAPPVESGRQ